MLPSRNNDLHDSSSTSSDSPATSDYRPDSKPTQPRRPIPRKGHTKSRRGCFNCKRRRIKCNEKHPECNHCVKAGLQCDYPANVIQLTQRSTSPSHPQEVVNLHSTPGTFVSVFQAASATTTPNQVRLWQTCACSTTSSSLHILICPSAPTRSGSPSYQVSHTTYDKALFDITWS